MHTVPSDFKEQDVQTETQADRIDREEEAKAAAKAAKEKAAAKARKADNWLTRQFASLSGGASDALVVTNFAAILGVGAFLGYKAWNLYERGRLGWKETGLGVAILSTVGVVESVFVKCVSPAI